MALIQLFQQSPVLVVAVANLLSMDAPEAADLALTVSILRDQALPARVTAAASACLLAAPMAAAVVVLPSLAPMRLAQTVVATAVQVSHPQSRGQALRGLAVVVVAVRLTAAALAALAAAAMVVLLP